MSDDPTLNSMLNDKIDTLRDALGAVESRMGERLTRQDEYLREIKDQTTATNGRVTLLEKAQERTHGVFIALSWLPPLVTGVITALVTGGMTVLIMALTGALH